MLKNDRVERQRKREKESGRERKTEIRQDCEYITQLYKEPAPCYLKSVLHTLHAVE